MTVDVFRPVSETWAPVSPALATARRLVALPCLLLPALALSVGAATPLPAWLRAVFAVGALALLTAAVLTWVWAGRNQRSWGYAEAEDDLLVTRGVMFKRLVAVPYGRMQFVDVSAGPIARRLGIATVTLHTASTETAADIPGVPAEEARRLRNSLTEVGEAHGAGV
ncbi:PH domain-containing protein [Aeromicrobium sp. CTD01-1L150]|uniref:PH domain-containing protein n=1 Tax=Aeromicrobium sp. CTD01-1L150 TaxID=3341830 RepID=UPI0035BECC7E